jgi:hypothetical protein
MQTFRAVAIELFQFVFQEWFGFRQTSQTNLLLEAPAYTWTPVVPDLPRPTINQTAKDPTLTSHLPVGEQATVIVPEAQLLASPAYTLDGVLAHIKYGQKIEIIDSSNRWFAARLDNLNGWILRDNVTFETTEPKFVLGQFYGPETMESKTVRSTLADDFNGELAQLPLTPEEYVAYKFKKQGRPLTWGTERPRLAGRWQILLRGRSGVHIGIIPKTSSAIEIIDEHRNGHLAYVESVFPDQSILISEIGFPEIGQYNERKLPKEEWIEWRPVFIEIN